MTVASKNWVYTEEYVRSGIARFISPGHGYGMGMASGEKEMSTLRRAGRVTEVAEGAARRADAMFAWDPQPWCPFLF